MEYMIYLSLFCEDQKQYQAFQRLLDRNQRPDFEEDVASEDLELWRATESVELPGRIEPKEDEILALELTYDMPPCDPEAFRPMSQTLSRYCRRVVVYVSDEDNGGFEEYEVVAGEIKPLRWGDDGGFVMEED